MNFSNISENKIRSSASFLSINWISCGASFGTAESTANGLRLTGGSTAKPRVESSATKDHLSSSHRTSFLTV